MWNKLIVWLKTKGIKSAIDSLDMAKPYLATEIKKVEGNIGETPEAKANWIIDKTQEFLRKQFGIS